MIAGLMEVFSVGRAIVKLTIEWRRTRPAPE
jgi:hypothetical protein